MNILLNENIKNFNELPKQHINLDFPKKSVYTEFSSRNDAMLWGKKHFSSWLSSLPQDEKISLTLYSSNLHKTINPFFRRNADENFDISKEEIEHIKKISKALSKAVIPENIVVFRGISLSHIQKLFSLNHKASPQETSEKLLNMNYRFLKVKERSFTSTTLLPSVADWFSSSCFPNSYSFVLRINVPKGTHGAYIQDISRMHNEMEILLQRNQTLHFRGAVLKKMLQYNRIEVECDLLEY